MVSRRDPPRLPDHRWAVGALGLTLAFTIVRVAGIEDLWLAQRERSAEDGAG